MARGATAVRVTEIGGQSPTNGAKGVIDLSQPYVVSVTVQGTADMLFHRWNVEAVDDKAKSAKGSKAKKSDDLESYVYRCENGNIGMPGEYLRQSIIHAAKFRQDPRSPRKSAMDLFKAGVISLTQIADLGKPTWDYEDRRRALIQRNAINRTRPAIKKGWEGTFEFMVNLPEYIPPDMLNDVIAQAGKLVGVADFRPTYGRFSVTRFEVVDLD